MMKKNVHLFKEEVLGKRQYKKTENSLPAGIKSCMTIFSHQFCIIMKFNQKKCRLLLFGFRVLFAVWIKETIFVDKE